MINGMTTFEANFSTVDPARSSPSLSRGGRPGPSGIFLDLQGVEIGSVGPSATHARGFLAGFQVEPFEVSAIDALGGFQWRLFSERRGFTSGLTLSLAATDEDAERAKGDPLWTVGTLGREHLPTPRPAPDEADPRVVFFHGDGARLLIDDHKGDLWATLDGATLASRHTLRRWDGRFLGHLDTHERDHTAASWALTPSDRLDDRLEVAALEAAPWALWRLSDHR